LYLIQKERVNDVQISDDLALKNKCCAANGKAVGSVQNCDSGTAAPYIYCCQIWNLVLLLLGITCGPFKSEKASDFAQEVIPRSVNLGGSFDVEFVAADLLTIVKECELFSSDNTFISSLQARGVFRLQSLTLTSSRVRALRSGILR